MFASLPFLGLIVFFGYQARSFSIIFCWSNFFFLGGFLGFIVFRVSLGVFLVKLPVFFFHL